MSRVKLGQHFLIDNAIVQRQIEYAELTKDDIVLEIGPGKGVLTTSLAKSAGLVIAVEKDETLYQALQDKVPSNVALLHHDILTIDDKYIPSFTKSVSNLPYEISSPFTFWLLQKPFVKAVLMYQKEFADRMVAKPGTNQYSRLSVAIYYYAQSCILETVSKRCFKPQPEVDSCLVELIPRSHPPFQVKDESLFFELVKTLFNHRRKQIKNTISNQFGISIDDHQDATKRVESLTPKQIGLLSDILCDRLKKKD